MSCFFVSLKASVIAFDDGKKLELRFKNKL